jgi:hypothetical protein
MAVRPMTVSLTASHQVRVTDWFQARSQVPVSALEEHWNEKSRQKTSRGEKRATSRQIVDLECL